MKISHFIRHQLERLKYSKDGRTVFANLGYLSLLQIAGYAFPLITMPYLARVIGPEGFGRISFAAAVMVWGQTIADWGFNYTATRDIAQNRDDREKVSEIFSNVLWARCILTFAAGLLLALVTVLIPYFRENSLVLFVTFLMIPGHILFPDWFFQAVEKMKYTTAFNLCMKLIFTVLVFAVIKTKDDYIYQPLLTTIGYIICGMASLWLIVKRWGYSIKAPNFSYIITTIKSSTDVFVNNLMPNLYNSFSIMLLGICGGSTANGIFDGGNKFAAIVQNLQNVVSRAFFPFLSRRTDKHHLFAKINIGTALLASLCLIVFSPFIVKIMLGPEFKESVPVMIILAVSLVFISVSNTYGTNFLIVHHQEKMLRYPTMVASLIGMALAYPLIKSYSYIGAALVIAFSRFLLSFLIYLQARRFKKAYNL